MYYCEICGCDVPEANWIQHINGKRHQSNECDTDLESSDNYTNCDSDSNSCDIDDSELMMVSASDILYKQDSIAPHFSDGTSLEEGIDTIQCFLYECDPYAFPYIVDVWETDEGYYVAMNTRTLYCYEQAGFDVVPVNVIGHSYNGRRYRSIFVRGQRVQ